MGAECPRHLDGIAFDDQFLYAVAFWVWTGGSHASGDVARRADCIAVAGKADPYGVISGKPQCPTEGLGDGHPEDGQTYDGAVVSAIRPHNSNLRGGTVQAQIMPTSVSTNVQLLEMAW
jgi:hypothetical protein